MSVVTDLVDWLGGLPFQTASPGEVVDKFFEKGFVLTKLKTVGGRSGRNEYVFAKPSGRVVGLSDR